MTGVEPAAASAAAAPEAIRSQIRVEPFRRETLAGESFDLVTSFQTLEHVSDPSQVVRDAFELLEIGGAVLVVVHDRRALLARLMRQRSPIYDVEHVQLFSVRSVRELLQRAGFEEIRVARRHQPLSAPVLDEARAHPRRRQTARSPEGRALPDRRRSGLVAPGKSGRNGVEARLLTRR